MGNARESDRGKDTGRKNARRKGDIKAVKIEGKEDKEQEVTIRHGTIAQKKAGSVWSWHEEFAIKWSETLITRKKKHTQN